MIKIMLTIIIPKKNKKRFKFFVTNLFIQMHSEKKSTNYTLYLFYQGKKLQLLQKKQISS